MIRYPYEEVVQEWRGTVSENTTILKCAIDAMENLGKYDKMAKCCHALAMRECNDEEYIRNRQLAASHLSYCEQYPTHMQAAGYLWDAIDFIEQNPHL